MAPYEHVLLVKNYAAFLTEFAEQPGTRVIEWISSSLGNGGETLRLVKPGDYDLGGTLHYILVDRVEYSDGAHPLNFPEIGIDPWPIDPDGGADTNSDSIRDSDRALDRTVDTAYGNDPTSWQSAAPSPGW
jgi:hypothetical protein